MSVKQQKKRMKRSNIRNKHINKLKILLQNHTLKETKDLFENHFKLKISIPTLSKIKKKYKIIKIKKNHKNNSTNQSSSNLNFFGLSFERKKKIVDEAKKKRLFKYELVKKGISEISNKTCNSQIMASKRYELESPKRKNEKKRQKKVFN